MSEASIWRKLFLCRFSLCQTFQTVFDDPDGIWGECTICGKRSGYVARADLRAYMDREDAAKEQALTNRPE